MLASRLISNGLPNRKHGLADVVKEHLGIQLDKEQQRSDWSGRLTQEQITYAAKDVEVLCELDDIILDNLAEKELSGAYELECLALPAMAQMWRTGLPPGTRRTFNRESKTTNTILKSFQKSSSESLILLPEDQKLPRDEDDSFNLRAQG